MPTEHNIYISYLRHAALDSKDHDSLSEVSDSLDILRTHRGILARLLVYRGCRNQAKNDEYSRAKKE